MDSEQRDFKAVKVQMKSSQKSGETLSRSMLYSGINIFGQLSQMYIQQKESGASYQEIAASIGRGPSSEASGDPGSVMSLSQEVLSIFKRLQKKDSTTKIKAFQELERYVDSIDNTSSLNQSMQSEDISGQSTQTDEMQSLLTFFLYHFCRIVMNEPDKKVREAAHLTLAIFIKKAKRRLGPHLKRIFSLWYCSFFDVSPEVASLSRRNFETAFPQNKRDQVFKIAYKNFLHFANEQLKQSEDQITESVADLSKAQREDVFDRITSSVLQALAKSFEFTQEWTEEERNHFKKKLIDILDLSAPIPSVEASEEKKGGQMKKAAQPQSYLWGFLQNKYRGRVRASCLLFISNLIQNLPKDIVEAHITQLAPLVYGLIGEDNSQLQGTLWREALFALGKNFPNSWETTNIKKNFLPKLYTTLKASAFGAPASLYENFVKFVSVFPLYHLIDYTEDKLNKASFKERCNLIRETLTTLYQGLKNDEAVAFHQDLTKCYYETFSFLVLKRVQPLIQSDKASQEDKDFAIQQLKKCIQLPLEDYLNNFERFTSKVQNQRNIRYTIPIQMAKMLKDLAERNLDSNLYTTLLDFMNESINLSIEKPNLVRVIHSVLKDSVSQDSPYYNKGVMDGLIIKIVTQLNNSLQSDVENLGKETIDSFNKKLSNLQRILYKLNKFKARVNADIMNKTLAIQQDLFHKIQRKEEIAKSVITSDILVKFKHIKATLLKGIILIVNQTPDVNQESLQNLLQQVLLNKSADNNLKEIVLLPGNEFKKVKFVAYYSILQQPALHSLVVNFVLNHVIADDTLIGHFCTLIDKGLQLLKEDENSSFFTKEDQSTLAQSVFSKINSLKPQDFIHLQYYFNSIKQLLIGQETASQKDLLELLFSKLLVISSTHPSFQALWAIYSQTLKLHLVKGKERTPYFQYCIQALKEKLQSIIQEKVYYSQRGVAQFDAINRFTLIVKSFVQLLPAQSADRQQVIEEILLQEENFKNIESNSLPLKMFRDLFLTGGLGGFDVTKLFSESKYVWLASALLNTRHISSLANFIEMKRQLVIFVDTELIPLLINQAQSGNSQLVVDIMKHMGKKGTVNTEYGYSLEYLIKKMIDPGEDFPVEEKPVLKIDDFKEIFNAIGGNVVQELLKETNIAQYSQEVLLFLRILRQVAYYIIDESSITKLYKKCSEQLSSFTLQHAFTPLISISLEVYDSLVTYLGTSVQGTSDELSKKLILQLLSTKHTRQLDSNMLNAILQFIAHTLDHMGVTSFTNLVKDKVNFQDFLSQIMTLQREQHLQPLTYINMLSIIRKTVNSPDLIADTKLVVDQIIDISKENALAFDMKISKVQELVKQSVDVKEPKKSVMFSDQSIGEEQEESKEEDEEEYQIEDFEFEMLQEAAETMIAMTNHVTPSLNENDLYILIGSGVEALQKAAFVLLKYLYNNFIPHLTFKINDFDMLKQIQQEAKDSEVQEQVAQQEESKGGDHYKHHDHEKYKNKLAFKNISEILIEMLENPPAIGADGSVHPQHIISGSTHVESLVFQEAHSHSQQLNSKVFGYFLAWNAMLTKIENGRIKSQLSGDQEYSQVLGALNEYLEENDGIYRMLLVQLLAYLPEEKRGLTDAYNVSGFEPEYLDLTDKKSISLLTVYTLLNFMKSFPSLARKYYQECDKQLLELVMPYIKQIVSPAILENEIKKIEVAQLQLGQNELTFSLFKSTKEILANFKKGEIEMTLKIKIPADYPLKLVEVDVSRQLKISEKQLRKWILAIRKIIQFQNGDIISAVLAWKANIEKEIEGVEDCYICYCVVHETDQSLPKMPCKTCKNKFHVACIRKWFRQSHKSNCPICQNYFF